MDIRINFLGGPANGGKGTTDSLDNLKLIFEMGDREIHAYPRLYDTEYLYSPELSESLTADFDAIVETYEGTTVGMSRKDEA